MSKFIDSEEGIPQELIPFDAKTTQVVIKAINEVKYLPINSFLTSDTVNFVIPAQHNLMIKNVEVVTKFKIDGLEKTDTNVTLVSNPANALWKQVDILLNNKVHLSNPMQQSSNYESFFSTVLNVDQEREDVIFSNQGFLLDKGLDKATAEVLSKKDLNANAKERAKLISAGKSTTLISDLYCSLFKNPKLLIPGLEFSISMTKNSPEFLLMSNSKNTANFKLVIENIYLNVTYVQPEEFYLSMLEERLEKTPAIYDGHRTEISTFGIQSGVTSYQFNNIFRGTLPHFMVVCIQDREAISGDYTKNPFTFYPFKSIQVSINNREYFADPLESSSADNALMMNHFYKTLGYDVKGTCLINRENFRLHFMVPIALSRDRTVKFHHNLQEVADFKVDIVFDEAIKDNKVLMVYSVYDQIIKIDKDRNIEKI